MLYSTVSPTTLWMQNLQYDLTTILNKPFILGDYGLHTNILGWYEINQPLDWNIVYSNRLFLQSFFGGHSLQKHQIREGKTSFFVYTSNIDIYDLPARKLKRSPPDTTWWLAPKGKDPLNQPSFFREELLVHLPGVFGSFWNLAKMSQTNKTFYHEFPIRVLNKGAPSVKCWSQCL